MGFGMGPSCNCCGGGGTVEACTCDISTALQTYLTNTNTEGAAVIALTYVAAPGLEFPGWGDMGEGWYGETAIYRYRVGVGCVLSIYNKFSTSLVGTGSVVVTSCSPLLINFTGTLASGRWYE